MTLPLELGQVADEWARRAFQRIAQRFPLAPSTDNFQQVPQVRVFHNAAVAIANATLTVLGTTAGTTTMFNSERWDLGTPNLDMHDTATNPGRLTCRVAGLYQINGYTAWDINAAGGRQVRLRVNGTDRPTQTAPVASAAFGAEQALSGEYRLAVGEFVEMVVFQNSGGALNLTLAELGMYWISP